MNTWFSEVSNYSGISLNCRLRIVWDILEPELERAQHMSDRFSLWYSNNGSVYQLIVVAVHCNYSPSLGAGDSGLKWSPGECKSGRRETMASLSLKQWETMLVVISSAPGMLLLSFGSGHCWEDTLEVGLQRVDLSCTATYTELWDSNEMDNWEIK